MWILISSGLVLYLVILRFYSERLQAPLVDLAVLHSPAHSSSAFVKSFATVPLALSFLPTIRKDYITRLILDQDGE
tara:strand:- start:92 stop:319 length:228 start_codon:yes stop_codon:yes gene_type:complete